MARTSNVFARVEPEVKEQAEIVLEQLGIPMSNAIGMFLRQVVLQRGLPFEMKLPERRPGDLNRISRAQLDLEMRKGMEDLRAGRARSADEVHAQMRAAMQRERGI